MSTKCPFCGDDPISIMKTGSGSICGDCGEILPAEFLRLASPDDAVEVSSSSSSSSSSLSSSTSSEALTRTPSLPLSDSGSPPIAAATATASANAEAPQSLSDALSIIQQKDATILSQQAHLDATSIQADQLQRQVAAAARALAQMRAAVDSMAQSAAASAAATTASPSSPSAASTSTSLGGASAVEIDSLRRELAAVADRLEASERDAVRVREAERECARLQKRADEAERSATAYKSESANATAQLQQFRAAADEKLTRAQREYLESQAAVTRLEAQTQELQLEKSNIALTLQRIEAETASQRSMHAQLQEHLQAARDEVQEKMRAYLDLMGQKKIVDQNVTRLAARDEQNKKEIEHFQAKTAELDATVKELQPYRSEAENNRRAVARLNDENKAFKVQLFDLQAEADRAKAELAEALNFTETLMEEIEQLKGAAGAAQ